MEYDSNFKKKEILPYVITWMNLEDIMPSEKASHRTNAEELFLYKWSKTFEVTKRESNSLWGMGEGGNGQLFFNGYPDTVTKDE